MLLSSALYFTIIVVYRQPLAAWDWRIALASLPVLLLDVFVTPDTIAPMILALSTECFVDKAVVNEVEREAKFAKFARTAKLLHAMRSKAKLMKRMRKRDSDDPGAPVSVPSRNEYLQARPPATARHRPPPCNRHDTAKRPPSDRQATAASPPR